jgi:hypothetical protein
MKNYLKALRWCLWAAALLPLVYYAGCANRLFGMQLYEQLLFIAAYIALFVWAGGKAMQSNYSIPISAFAGPLVLVVSQLCVSPVLIVITWPMMIDADRPLWAGVTRIILTAIMAFLFSFPIALGCSALGAYLKRKSVI